MKEIDSQTVREKGSLSSGKAYAKPSVEQSFGALEIKQVTWRDPDCLLYLLPLLVSILLPKSLQLPYA